MKEQISYKELGVDSVHGKSVQVIFTFSSFDLAEIDKLIEHCKVNIHSGIIADGVAITENLEDMSRKDRLEAHVKTLQKMRNAMLEDKNWESLKPEIEAVTTGGMAIQRIIREDSDSSCSEGGVDHE